jgi:O-antigen/teichoic acid export membrane protein
MLPRKQIQGAEARVGPPAPGSAGSSLRSILALTGQSAAYGIGVLGSQFVSYLTFPVLTHAMQRDEYGAVSVIAALYAFLNTLTFAGLPAATFRFYSEGVDDEDRRRTLGSAQLLSFLFAAVPAIAVLLFGESVSLSLLGSARFAPALQFAACFLVVDSMNFFGDIILRIQVRPLASSLLSILAIACEAGTALLLVTVFRMGASGYWLGFLIGGMVALGAMIWMVRKALVFGISRERAAELLAFGIPLIPTAISMTALRLADRYLIGSMAGLDQVAIYDVGYKVGALVSLVIGPFRAAWQPFAFSMAQKPEAPKLYRDVLSYLAAGCTFLVLGIVAFRRELVQLVAPASYAGAADIVPWVAAAQLFVASYVVLSIGPMITKRTRDLAWAAVSAGILNVLLNFLLIPRIGILGAALATSAAYLVLVILTYFISKRSFPIPIDWRRMGLLLLASIFVLLLLATVERLQASAWLQLAAKSAALLAFPSLTMLLGIVTPTQVRAALKIVKEVLLARSRRR